MAVAHRASATLNENAATTTGTITIPGSVATGDDLYVVARTRTASTITCTDDDSGGNTWTALGNTGTLLWLFWKKATSATASKTVTIANAVDSCTGGLSAFSGGLNSGDPTTNLTFFSNTSGTEMNAGFTPSFADSMICFGHGATAINLVTLIATTNPGSLEPELWERSSTGGSTCYTIFAARIQVGGPTATGNFTWAQTNAATRTLQFAIRAEAVTATGASTLAGVTSAGSGTYTPGAITGTGAITLAGATSAGSGTFLAAITGTGASTLAGVSCAGSGVFTGLGPIPGTGGNRMGGNKAIRKPPRLSGIRRVRRSRR